MSYAAAVVILGNPASAQDLTRETYLQAFRRPPAAGGRLVLVPPDGGDGGPEPASRAPRHLAAP